MLHLNVAACLLKMGEWRKSLETCNKVTFNEQRFKGLFLNHKLLFLRPLYPQFSKQVLEAKPGHVKGLYRRGMAYMAGGEYEDARNDFNMVYYPKNCLL